MSTAPIAYFCAEFGIESKLPLYAGGLGILAGDTLKQAADLQLPLVGIGLLYRGEGFVQQISPEGVQTELDADFDPVRDGLEHVYVDEMPLFIKVHLTELDVWCRCWKKTLSPTVTLYLLDTETDQNELNERSITHLLYSGTEESVIKQHLILGIGGVKLLHALNIHPRLYHVQEGRPALLHWQLVRSYMEEHGLSFEEARNQAKTKTVYTNHTLVSAGNQNYDANLLKRYAQYYADKLGVSVETLLQPGLENEPDRFYVTRFALNTSRKASGVSQLHTKLSQSSWPEYSWVNITNGVHLPTWQDTEMPSLVAQPRQLWERHLHLKRSTMEYIQRRTGYGYNPEALVITWSRRLAGYKRYDALFSEIEQVAALMKNSQRPVQLLMAGKAHRLDSQGKQRLQEIIQHMQQELAGCALFIPNYDIELAQHLVRGSDVWLNTPELGKEACGTSGMKAISNGVLQCSVLDGWAAEVDWSGMGWALDSQRISDSVYETLKNQIVPTFFDHRTAEDFSPQWIEMMQRSIALSSRFSAGRMLQEYETLLYKT
ncbi:MAG TPA: alpha-glucan family phosphorylase [Vitreimonas sp.]|nr:alpha-glucan family phosphorylase [Vitreimonas sp.]